MDSITAAEELMTEFAESTGLSRPETSPVRYLWTDAFAVCNFLELHRQTRDEKWNLLALRLVDQVHSILGRHRKDDTREGWISGLGEEEGVRHPTRGGLRIGKPLPERKPSDLYDDPLEWERDGQYYHYLTRWMHALIRVSRSTGDPVLNSWAIELAKAAHAGFVRASSSGSKRMFWKMSIDLTYPLVSSMGQHDPLDGLVTYMQIQATATALSREPETALATEIADLEEISEARNWATEDPLGIGGLLCDAYKVVQLVIHYGFESTPLLMEILESAICGLETYAGRPLLLVPAEYRLAFRELGLSIGLHAVGRMEEKLRERPDAFPENPRITSQMKRLSRHSRLSESIEKFWLDPRNQKTQTWTEHRDINSVMLATSLAPEGYLGL